MEQQDIKSALKAIVQLWRKKKRKTLFNLKLEEWNESNDHIKNTSHSRNSNKLYLAQIKAPSLE